MLVPGDRLGPYAIVSALGAGGMGEVYRARDTRLGREVAFKVLPEALAHDPGRLKRFEREAKAAAALSHPNVLTVFDVGSENGRAFVVTELLEGTTLGALLRRGPLPVHEALSLAAQAARGLAAAHAKGIVHRDLKPENLFLVTSGVLKILDFGLARLQSGDGVKTQETTDSHATGPGAVLGTVSYMSPEQAMGRSVDARSDLFSLGIVLHEMLSGRHPFKRASSAETVSAILRDEPAGVEALHGAVPNTVVRLAKRCLEKRPEDRFQSASDLALALDLLAQGQEAGHPPGTTTPTASAASEERPYPGLSSFGEADAAHFFGREDEVRALWEKIRRQRLLAVMGPSGVGKTSYLRAGVLAHRPTGWAGLYCTPGASPVAALARALSVAMAGEAPRAADDGAEAGELMQGVADFLQHGESGRLVSVVSGWRARRSEVLLVVDQFEELFTLNPADTQERFAALLGRLAEEAGVHVLLALRDDFLFRCHGLPALDALFQDLTPLGVPSAGALRRALVEPAARLGVRFEDEGLAREMVATVTGERGALPLMAFTAARLWEERDRDRRLLTRAAYEAAGGVAGALAQHAEATLRRIGPGHEAVVRRAFRELVTAEGTRASRSTAELLSVFGDEGSAGRGEAAEVLDALVAARLLTEFEASSSPAGVASAERHLEIVHESLLTHWPRLGRWLAQDAEGALLRDQFRQAAKLWEEMGRPEELLWTGRAFREYALWRERHPERLSAAEEAFATQMTAAADRRRRRRRAATAAVVASLAAGLVIVAALWGRSEAARQRAEAAGLRAEASKLLALGQVEIDAYPTAAVAYALKSLELSDSQEARLFALRALQRGPTAILVPVPADDEDAQAAFAPAFSPDGQWLAVGGLRKVQLLHRDGGPARVIGDSASAGFEPFLPDFGPRNDRLFATKGSGDARVWSVPDGRELWRAEMGPLWQLQVSEEGVVFLPPVEGKRATIRSRRFDESESRLVMSVPAGQVWAIDSGQWIGCIMDRRSIHLRSLRDRREPERVLRTDSADLVDVSLDPRGRLLGAREATGRILVWHVGDPSGRPFRVLSGQGTAALYLDPQGRWVAAWRGEGGSPVPVLWDLTAPAAAEPLALRRSDTQFLASLAFQPSGPWLAVGNVKDTAFWRLGGAYPQVFTDQGGPVDSVAFTPDGRQIVSGSHDGRGTVRAWSLSAEGAAENRVLAEVGAGFPFITIAPDGRHVAVASGGRVRVVPLGGGPVRELDGFSDGAGLSRAGFDDSGRLVAAGPFNGTPEDKVVRVWDLETGAVRVLGPVPAAGDGFQGGIGPLSFLSADTVVAPVNKTGFVLFQLRDGTSRFLSAEPGLIVALSRSARFVLYARSSPGNPASPLVRLDLDRGETRVLASHGASVFSMSLDPSETLVATGSMDGTVRVGPVSGGEPHVLFGHGGMVRSVAFSPDGRWLASSGEDKTVRLWRVPEAGATPFHLLPREVLLARLRGSTNLRAVQDASAPGGYRLEPGPFPGWASVADR